MGIEKIKAYKDVMYKSFDLLEKSKDGLTTYSDDSDADHGDGQQVGREKICIDIIKFCCEKIIQDI